MNNEDTVIGFIGAGNMATALISGLIIGGLDPKKIIASSPEEEHLELLSKEFGIRTSEDNKEIIEISNTVILAVKPNIIRSVLTQLSDLISPQKHLIISIAAGVMIQDIQEPLGPNQRIVRAMPNTPASIQRGVTALCQNDCSTLADKELTEYVFKSVSSICWLKESSLDLYTALIGSGPAYIFYIIEALLEASKDLDYDKNKLKDLIIEMIVGSAELAKQSSDAPHILRKKVTSPGGVTEKALEVFKKNKIKDSIVDAINQAKERSIDLGGK